MFYVLVTRNELISTQWEKVKVVLRHLRFEPQSAGKWKKDFESKPKTDECLYGLRNYLLIKNINLSGLEIERFPADEKE